MSEQLRNLLRQSNARWQAVDLHIAALPPEEQRKRLGYVPGPGEAPLDLRERLSAASHELFLATRVGAAPVSYPPHFDWRDYGGKNYITPVKDQGSCGSCVAFGSIATVEATLRCLLHNPDFAVNLSEAHLFYCYAASQGRRCGGPNGGWWVAPALDACRDGGVVDQPCFPYTAGDQPCHLCADWSNRVTKIEAWHQINSATEMKNWLSSRGPLVTCFTVYDDFFAYHSGIYHHVSGGVAGGHCVCVVGYNDTDSCWICKNSWGNGWGEGGFFRIQYGQCGIDATMWAVDGIGGLYHKVVVPETATGGPALININDTIMGLAWTGTDSPHHLNVISSHDGVNFGNKVTLPETSIDGPGFAFGNGRAFLAWTGIDSAHHLNVVSSPDCHTFTNKVTLGDTSPFGPALAFGNGRLFLAWTGTDSHHSLNVMSSTDGMHFGNKVTLGDNSGTSPGLAFIDGKLYLLWSGTDGNHSLNIMESTDGMHFSNKVTLSDSSDFHPALAKRNLFSLVWTGRDSAHHLNCLTGPSVHALGNKVTYGDTSVAGLSLINFKGVLYVTWTGTDGSHHVNVAELRRAVE
jgi:C1A family cysteine protease